MTDLFQAASLVRKNAYAPYSNFKVGAAVATPSGEVFVGCNVENVAYPEGTCAEAGAIAAMVAAGQSVISQVMVVADSPVPISPCGGCRQKLAEFGAADVKVSLRGLDGEGTETTLGELLPGAFASKHLERPKDE